MTFMQLDKKGAVFVLTLTNGDKDNTFNPDVLAEYHACLDQIEADRSNASLLVVSNHPKTFCNGIDLPWLMAQDGEGFKNFVQKLEQMLLRIAVLDLPVIMAINGNCYAGGAIMASGADFRLMRADRGRFCYSEVNIKIPFTPVMTEIIRELPDKQALKVLALTGKAIGGAEALEMKVADSIHAEDELLPAAMALAEMMAEKDRGTYGAIKRLLRKDLTAMAKQQGLIRG